jgi:hypothetical protein
MPRFPVIVNKKFKLNWLILYGLIAQCFHSGQNELAPAAAVELLVLE